MGYNSQFFILFSYLDKNFKNHIIIFGCLILKQKKKLVKKIIIMEDMTEYIEN